MRKEKLLIFNISTDAKNTSLGFAISWINKFSEHYLEVDVVTLHKGDLTGLNKNIRIYSEDFSSSSRLVKFIKIRKIIKNLIKKNDYKFCLSHMSASLLLVSSTIIRFKNVKTLFWYTHKGPTTIFKKIVLYIANTISDKIITASENSYPIKSKKVTTIGHAINYELFYRNKINIEQNNFLIFSRISKSKNIESSIQGFLNSTYGKSNKITIIGGPLTNDDEVYQNSLIEKYMAYSNVQFLGPVPHAELNKHIDRAGFHINNTPIGFYDKSVLETMASGLINFYSNPDYDRNINQNFLNYLKFDGSVEDLKDKINLVSQLDTDKLIKIINNTQKKASEESIETLHQRITSVI